MSLNQKEKVIGDLILTLASFKTRVRFVDHIDATFASNNATITMASLKRFYRANYLHNFLTRQNVQNFGEYLANFKSSVNDYNRRIFRFFKKDKIDLVKRIIIDHLACRKERH